MSTHIHIMHVCMHVCMYACMHVKYIYACMYVWADRAFEQQHERESDIYVYMYACVCVCVYGQIGRMNEKRLRERESDMYVYMYVCVSSTQDGDTEDVQALRAELKAKDQRLAALESKLSEREYGATRVRGHDYVFPKP